MPSITPMMSEIFFDDALISSIVDTTCDTTLPPRVAISEAEFARPCAWLAASALWRRVLVSSSIELAACCRLPAVCSVRALRSWLPLATWVLATWICSVELRISHTMRVSESCILPSDAVSCADSSSPTARQAPVRSPEAMRSAAFWAACTGPTMLRVRKKPSRTEHRALIAAQTMLTTLVAVTEDAMAPASASARRFSSATSRSFAARYSSHTALKSFEAFPFSIAAEMEDPPSAALVSASRVDR